jgi:hypothetical protein
MLKRLFLLGIVTFCIYTNIGAQELYSTAGLYQAMPGMGNTYYATNPPEQFAFFVWFEPRDLDINCVEYRIEFPPNVTVNSIITNPLFVSEEGFPVGLPGVSICLAVCEYNWFWTHQFICTVEDYECGWVMLWSYNDNANSFGMSCSNPEIESIIVFQGNIFGVNCSTANKESSWGAIKGMYK